MMGDRGEERGGNFLVVSAGVLSRTITIAQLKLSLLICPGGRHLFTNDYLAISISITPTTTNHHRRNLENKINRQRTQYIF